jgi:hypothetical protein
MGGALSRRNVPAEEVLAEPIDDVPEEEVLEEEEEEEPVDEFVDPLAMINHLASEEPEEEQIAAISGPSINAVLQSSTLALMAQQPETVDFDLNDIIRTLRKRIGQRYTSLGDAWSHLAITTHAHMSRKDFAKSLVMLGLGYLPPENCKEVWKTATLGEGKKMSYKQFLLFMDARAFNKARKKLKKLLEAEGRVEVVEEAENAGVVVVQVTPRKRQKPGKPELVSVYDDVLDHFPSSKLNGNIIDMDMEQECMGEPIHEDVSGWSAHCTHYTILTILAIRPLYSPHTRSSSTVQYRVFSGTRCRSSTAS